MGARKRPEESFSFLPFSGLKKDIDRKGIKLTSPPRRVSRDVSCESDDKDVFAAAMKDVREISEFREMPVYARNALPARRGRRGGDNAIEELRELAAGRGPVSLPDTQEYVEWVDPECSADIGRKLHRGIFSVQACLDLHGFTSDEGEAAVTEFLRGAVLMRFRCVKIIHGRGLRSPDGPVLKNMLVKLLQRRYRKKILAFSSARQCDGGLGALYILLR